MWSSGKIPHGQVARWRRYFLSVSIPAHHNRRFSHRAGNSRAA